MAKLILMSFERSKKLITDAKSWADNHVWFSDGKNGAGLAVAEYTANLEGLTIYPSMVGRDNPIESK